MAARFCENCGKPLEDGAKFCNSCGTVATVGANPVQTPPPQAAPAQPPQAAAQPQASAPVYYQAPAQQYQAPNQNYQAQPNYSQPYANPSLTAPLKVGQFIGMFIVSAIPLVGIIMIFIWAFGSQANLNKKNYARAVLILAVIGIILSIIFTIFFASIFASLFSDLSGGSYYY